MSIFGKLFGKQSPACAHCNACGAPLDVPKADYALCYPCMARMLAIAAIVQRIADREEEEEAQA